MSTNSAIEWTDTTWNPVVGCTRVSAGCDNCYAVGMTSRLDGMSRGGPNPGKGRTAQYRGLTVLNKRGERHFNGIVRTVPEALDFPLGWKKPKRVFVNSMSDLFHKDVPWEFIIRVLNVAKMCPQHTFQILTKRPEVAAAFFARFPCVGNIPNVWLGTSVEDQRAADERIPHLLRCPAAVRFLSCEPLLGPVDLEWKFDVRSDSPVSHEWRQPLSGSVSESPTHGRRVYPVNRIDWVIAGGESGPHARPCDVAWVRSIVEQCKKADVACFVKQLGAKPQIAPDVLDSWPGYPNIYTRCSPDGMLDLVLRDKNGGNPSEWSEDLRVREFPMRGAK